MGGLEEQYWARWYILNPLTAPEPIQKTGPACSHVVDPRLFSSWRGPGLPSPPLTPPPPSASPALPYNNNNRRLPLSAAAYAASFAPDCSHHDTSSDHLIKRCPPQHHPSRASDASARTAGHDDASRSAATMATHHACHVSALFDGHCHDFRGVTSSPRSRSLSPGLSGLVATTSGTHPSQLPRSRTSADMSDRPLDKIRAEARATERRHKQRKRATWTDSIDRLDTTGGPYHHAGPYDAALPHRNRDSRTSPLAAVRESILEAIRATPRENLVDALSRHVPLQGTASVAPGAADLSGHVMDYAEGADLRESDAPGGAYKRWAGVPYHPDNLKGKGEPSFSLERDRGAAKRQKRASMPASALEMLAGIRRRRRRPASVAPGALAAKDILAAGEPPQRAGSLGRRLGDGIRKRLGSIRRKKAMPAE